MPVGVVDRVVPDPDSSYVNVMVKPNADLGALEEVLVVVQFSDKMPFAQEKDLNQSEAVAMAAKQRAADILSEKLPSVRDPNAPDTTLGAERRGQQDGSQRRRSGPANAAAAAASSRPVHPRRGAPGGGLDPWRRTTRRPIERRPPKPALQPLRPAPKSNADTTTPSYATSDSTPVSRFPAKPGVVAAKPEPPRQLVAQ